MPKRASIVIVAIALGLWSAGPAAAANPRGQRTVAGVRAALSQFDAALLAGHSRTACALLTAKAQAQPLPPQSGESGHTTFAYTRGLWYLS
jgi:hypothetical protein